MKLNPLVLDGITYTPSMIASLTQPVMDIRDVLLQQFKFDHAVSMCHVIALLNHLKENTNDEKPETT